MGLRIGTNTGSLAVLRQVRASGEIQASCEEKLASGSRIVRAGDDAAGLSISSKMHAEERSLRQAARNANDAISMIQVAEGASTELSNMIIRMRELAVQAASDTLGDNERGYLNREVSSLLQETDRIANATEFNGQHLLNVVAQFMEVQVGTSNDMETARSYIDLMSGNATVSRLGLDSVAVETKEQARSSLRTLDRALNKLSKGRAEWGAIQTGMQAAVNNLGVYNENISGARGRIQDVDIAHETAENAKASIIRQTAIAVMGQANSQGTVALKLLG